MSEQPVRMPQRNVGETATTTSSPFHAAEEEEERDSTRVELADVAISGNLRGHEQSRSGGGVFRGSEAGDTVDAATEDGSGERVTQVERRRSSLVMVMETAGVLEKAETPEKADSPEAVSRILVSKQWNPNQPDAFFRQTANVKFR